MLSKYLSLSLVVTVIAATGALSPQVHGQLETGWKAHDQNRPAPKVVAPGEGASLAKPPSDAVVLFDGKNFDNWTGGVDKWKIVDGAMETLGKSGPAVSKEEFGDCQLHVEWACPPDLKGEGQRRCNSGVFLMNAFELQVLDSHENTTYADGGAASIYGQYPPLVNASRGPGEWQSFDIIFRAPRFGEDGKLQKRARMTALHNGVLVQDNSEILGPTAWIKHGRYAKGKTTGSIRLQDHGTPVRYRNIWIRPLAAERAKPESPYPEAALELTPEKRKRLVGTYETRNQKEFHVFEKGDDIHCRLYGVRMKMLALSESEFVFEKCAGKISFQMDKNGKVESASLQLDAAGERIGKRKKGKPPKKDKPKSATEKPALDKSGK